MNQVRASWLSLDVFFNRISDDWPSSLNLLPLESITNHTKSNKFEKCEIWTPRFKRRSQFSGLKADFDSVCAIRIRRNIRSAVMAPNLHSLSHFCCCVWFPFYE